MSVHKTFKLQHLYVLLVTLSQFTIEIHKVGWKKRDNFHGLCSENGKNEGDPDDKKSFSIEAMLCLHTKRALLQLVTENNKWEKKNQKLGSYTVFSFSLFFFSKMDQYARRQSCPAGKWNKKVSILKSI